MTGKLETIDEKDALELILPENVYKVDKNLYENRVQTFKDYVEMYGEDDEEIELYLYDFIAFVLEEGRTNKTNNEFYNVFCFLFKEVDDNNTIMIKGTQLKHLYNSVKDISFSNELKKYLFALYYCNEEKREATYRLHYKYYKSEKEREILIKTVSTLTQRLRMIKDFILNRVQ